MSERISILELRALAEIAVDDAVAGDEFDAICDAFPALVEAVEAARAVHAHGAGLVSPDECELCVALSKFDFGDAA